MTYRTVSNLLLLAAAACLLAAIWAPGAWWQWLATGLVALIGGAYAGSQADQREKTED